MYSVEHFCRIDANVAASDCPMYRLYASTAARQGRVADLKPPDVAADEVEPVVPAVLQQDDKLRDCVSVVLEERVVDKPRDVRLVLLRQQHKQCPVDLNVPKRQEFGEPPLVRHIKDKDHVRQTKRPQTAPASVAPSETPQSR